MRLVSEVLIVVIGIHTMTLVLVVGMWLLVVLGNGNRISICCHVSFISFREGSD